MSMQQRKFSVFLKMLFWSVLLQKRIPYGSGMKFTVYFFFLLNAFNLSAPYKNSDIFIAKFYLKFYFFFFFNR